MSKTIVAKTLSVEGLRYLAIYWIVALSIRLTIVLFTGH
jgi:hypothetical protein